MPRMHTALAHIQECLDHLSPDELYLLGNFLKSQLGEIPVKRRQPAHQKSLSTGNSARLLEKVPSLSDPDKRALLKIVTLLCQALEPQKGKRGGMRSIEIKMIKRRMKSLYLGKEIALAIQSQPVITKTIKARVWQAINTDTLENLKAALRANPNQY